MTHQCPNCKNSYYNNSSRQYPRQSSGIPWDKNPYTPYGDLPYDTGGTPDEWVKHNPWMKKVMDKGKEEQEKKKKAAKQAKIDAIWVCINWKRIPDKLLKKT